MHNLGLDLKVFVFCLDKFHSLDSTADKLVSAIIKKKCSIGYRLCGCYLPTLDQLS